MSQFEDREITCVEGNDHTFRWSARSQAFYAEMGYQPPKRCREHAQARRQFFNEHPEKVGGRQKRGHKERRRGYQHEGFQSEE